MHESAASCDIAILQLGAMTPAVGNDIVPYGPARACRQRQRGERAQAADFDTTYQQYLSSNSLSQTDPGVTVGQPLRQE